MSNIILYTLLLNATHLIQPLDLSLKGSIKMNYRECVRKWLENKPGGMYDKNAFIKVFAKVHKKAATVENAMQLVDFGTLESICGTQPKSMIRNLHLLSYSKKTSQCQTSM